nr:hypothetical protein Itr_chr14CG08180 [Ipomoea trifida]GMC75227.1 hypothetical protein Iba_chr03dCG2970 [Ipomoea batatas]GMD50167.1 hypothetical protein Iba_scaffold154748CG0010 [Ipomoea batatas]GME12098.1 hypothetical protein Iba_scaffold13334CG0040 [Ipomoea batatas]
MRDTLERRHLGINFQRCIPPFSNSHYYPPEENCWDVVGHLLRHIAITITFVDEEEITKEVASELG